MRAQDSHKIAHFPLDFPRGQTVGAYRAEAQSWSSKGFAISITDLLKSIRQRLDGAIAVARAAEAGDVERAVAILLDAEPLYEAAALLNAASLLNRRAEL